MEGSYIVTDVKRQTNMPGVHAAGYARATPLRLVVATGADSAIDAMQYEKYIGSLKKEKIKVAPYRAVPPDKKEIKNVCS